MINDSATMDEDQQFDKDDFAGLDGQNGENFEQQDTEQRVDDGGDQAMETGVIKPVVIKKRRMMKTTGLVVFLA